VTFVDFVYVRSRREDGREMSGRDEGEWFAIASGWFAYYLASFLEYVHRNRDIYAGFIEPAPRGLRASLRRLPLMQRGAARLGPEPVAWGAPVHLWTEGTGYDPMLDCR
jgi:hypothetical protein